MALGQKKNPWGPQVLVYFSFHQQGYLDTFFDPEPYIDHRKPSFAAVHLLQAQALLSELAKTQMALQEAQRKLKDLSFFSKFF